MTNQEMEKLRYGRVIEISKVISDRLNQLGLPEDTSQAIFDSLVDGLNANQSYKSIAQLHTEVMDSLSQPPWRESTGKEL